MATRVRLASLVTQAADGNLGTMFGAVGISATRATSSTSSGLAIHQLAGTAQVREVDELERHHNASVAAC
jgi:hypothetical protein